MQIAMVRNILYYIIKKKKKIIIIITRLFEQGVRPVHFYFAVIPGTYKLYNSQQTTVNIHNNII